MRERQRATRRGDPRLLLLVAALVAIVAATGVLPEDAGERSARPSARPEAPTEAARAPAGVTTAPGAARPTQPSTRPSKTERGPAEPTTSVPATMVAAAPSRLQVPSIGVDTELMDLGLQADGTLEVPPSGFPAGWYTGAPTPGELGPAVVAGHVDWGGRPGVFYELRELSPGDDIEITRSDGSIAAFRVTRVERFAKEHFPTQAVYGDIDHAGLRLITCGGAFDRQLRSYADNLVVFAELVTSGA